LAKETLLLPRKCLSTTERHLCPWAIQKTSVKLSFQPDPWGHWFPSPPEWLHTAFLISSLQIKSFQPLLMESTCTFILRVDPRTLKPKNSCMCHLCIYLLNLIMYFAYLIQNKVLKIIIQLTIDFRKKDAWIDKKDNPQDI
jgi:hypothetical protein